LDPATRRLVHGLKYQGHHRHAPWLVTAVAPESSQLGLKGDLLVPVPVHATRRRDRGYNQAELLAQAWSSRLGLPCEFKGLKRVKATITQTKLDADARNRNLNEALKADPRAFAGRKVILVDDVLTTGATLTACAAALLHAGADTVEGLVCLWAGEA